MVRMTEYIKIPVFPRCGKTIMQEMEWETLKCDDCGTKMELKTENEFESVKICPKCGRKGLLIKKLRGITDETIE